MFKNSLFVCVIFVSFIFLPTYAKQIPKDLIVTPSGLKYKVLKLGTGTPVADDKEVAFHWTGYLASDSSYSTSFGTSKGEEPFYFVTGKKQVIKGAEEGLALMKVGDRYLFVMPPELAYGVKGSGKSIPPNSTLVFDYEVMSVSEPKINIRIPLLKTIETTGIDAAIAQYHQIKADKQKSKKYTFRENELNNLGYKLINKKLIKEALKIFTLNTIAYPNSWNTYDSLAEAYLLNGDKDAALKLYKRSVELNPKSKVGIKQIAVLEAEMAK